MLYNRANYEPCPTCGQEKEAWKKCNPCEDKEKLAGVKCPCCKEANITILRTHENNGIMGSGYSSWVTSEKLCCMTCGVLFLDPKIFKTK